MLLNCPKGVFSGMLTIYVTGIKNTISISINLLKAILQSSHQSVLLSYHVSLLETTHTEQPDDFA